MMQSKPFIKWAGGKYKLADTIITEAEKHIDFTRFERYIDPFVGGGGMYFAFANRIEFKELFISDINEELINVYMQIKENFTELIFLLDKIELEYNSLVTIEDKKKYYYSLRELFNKNIEEKKLNVEQASIFIALNKLDFNGLYRVNSKGFFNVPFGQKRLANLYELENLQNVKKLLEKTNIYRMDYRDCIKYVNNKSLVYFDSPYRPLPGSKSFTSYTESDFNDEDQKELAKFSNLVIEKGGTFLLSNSDPKHTDDSDNFFDDLYNKFVIERISAQRNIGAQSKSRGKVSEILVIGKGKNNE